MFLQQHYANMSQPPPQLPEKFILELGALPPQTEQDLRANATLQRTTPQELLAKLLTKKLGGLFTIRAA